MSILKKVALEQGYLFDNQTETLFGQKNNYLFIARMYGNNNIMLMFSVKNDAAVQSLIGNVLKQEIRAVQAASFKNYKLSVTVKYGMTKKKLVANLVEAIEQVTAYLSANNYEQVCEVTGKTEDIHIYEIGNQFYFLTPEAFQQKSHELDQAEQENLVSGENVFLGLIGAFLGSLIGVAAIVAISQLGYVSFISGLVMGACVVKGYELLARRFSMKGVVVSVLVILVMTFIANQLDWAIALANFYGVSIFDTLPHVHELLAEGYIDSGTYYLNLVLVYLFSGIASVVWIVGALKNVKRKFVARQLF